MFSTAQSGSHPRIMKIRAYEDEKKDQNTAIAWENRSRRVAEWEISTDKRIKAKAVKQKYEALRLEAAQRLEERRNRLVDLLQAEEKLLQAELQSHEKTPQERRAAVEARARELRAKREDERRAFVGEQLERRWREACDPVRVANSKKSTLEAAEERRHQLEEKEVLRRQEAARRAEMERMLEGERLRQEAVHAAGVERRKALDAEAVHILDEQLEMVKAMEEEERESVRREVAAMKLRWEQEDELFRKQEAEIRARNTRIAAELVAYNVAQKREAAEREGEARRVEQYCVQLAVQKEREEAQRDRQLRDRQREEARMYRQYLQLMMQREIESEAERDAIIQQASNAEWARREAAWQRELEARARLMEEVDGERQQQLQEKEVARLSEEDEKRQELERMLRELEIVREEEEAAMRKRVEDKRRTLNEIDAQVQQKQLINLVKQQQAKRELEAGKQLDKQYENHIEEVTAEERPPPRHNRKAAQWYY